MEDDYGAARMGKKAKRELVELGQVGRRWEM